MFDNTDKTRVENIPIFRKGEEIYEVVDKICQLIPDDGKYLKHVKGIMFEDAMLLTAKVAAVEGGGPYDIKI